MPDGKRHHRTHRRPLLGLLCVIVILLLSSIIVAFAIKINGTDTLAQGQKPNTSTSKTATATQTPSPSPNPTPTPFFLDTFADNSQAWTVSRENDSSGYLRLLQNDQLILKDTNHQTLVESLPTNGTYADFTLTTTFTRLEGDHNDSVGLYLRGNIRLDQDYRIDIFGDNTLAITKEFLDAHEKPQTMLLHPPVALHSVQGQNTLTVMMKGPYILVMLNDEVVVSIVDPDYPQGQIALFVRNGATSTGISVAFDHIELKPVPEVTMDLVPTPTETTIINKTAPPHQ